MTVGQLINRLQKLVEANPENENISIRWYDEFSGHMCYGDGRPVQLICNLLTKEKYCILNAVDGPPGCCAAISDKGKKENEV
jgi:hypothetical protein